MDVSGSYILLFVVGLVIGSFLNVCILRIPRGESIIRPGSRCPKCQTNICWFDKRSALEFSPVESALSMVRGKDFMALSPGGMSECSGLSRDRLHVRMDP